MGKRNNCGLLYCNDSCICYLFAGIPAWITIYSLITELIPLYLINQVFCYATGYESSTTETVEPTTQKSVVETPKNIELAIETSKKEQSKGRKQFRFLKIPKYFWLILVGIALTVAIFLAIKNMTTPKMYEFEYSEEQIVSKENLPADFIVFLEKFTSNRETQISLIRTPFPIFHSYEVFDGEDELVDIATKVGEVWNKDKLEANWYFFTPISSTEMFGQDNEKFYGEWMLPEENIVVFFNC